jgi:hypothetical protein
MLRPTALITVALWLMACTMTPIDNQLTSGMADPQTGGGIGGTGITCSNSSSGISTLDGAGIACLTNTGGIGGTGLTDWSGGIGGTGVFGTITGFGSLIINGLHVDFAPDQKVESLLGSVTGKDLQIGQVVAVQANNVGQGLVAQRIVLQTALVGQVEAIDTEQSELVVAGERIVILPNLTNSAFSLEQLKVGDTLVVSGARDSEKLYASYVTHALENSLIKGQAAMASGVITKLNNTQITLDNSLIIDLSADVADEWTTGDFVTVEMGITTPKFNNLDKVQMSSTLVKKWYAKEFGGQLQRIAIEHITAGTGVVNHKKPANIKRKVQFFSRDKENKMRLEGSLQTEAGAWKRPSVKALKIKVEQHQLGVDAKAAKKEAKAAKEAGNRNSASNGNTGGGKKGNAGGGSASNGNTGGGKKGNAGGGGKKKK